MVAVLHNIPYATVSDSLLEEFNSSLNHNQFMAALPIAAASQGFQFGAKRKGFGFLSRGEDGFPREGLLVASYSLGLCGYWILNFGLGLVCRIWQVEVVLGRFLRLG